MHQPIIQKVKPETVSVFECKFGDLSPFSSFVFGSTDLNLP